MTDNEIIKALECCWHEKECIGDECPLFKPINDCAPLIAMEALDLINRQKAEIERLNTIIAETDKDKCNLIQAIPYIYKVKHEAVKEFAERLKSKYAQTSLGGMDKREIILYLTETQLIDELKEMVGENDGK